MLALQNVIEVTLEYLFGICFTRTCLCQFSSPLELYKKIVTMLTGESITNKMSNVFFNQSKNRISRSTTINA